MQRKTTQRGLSLIASSVGRAKTRLLHFVCIGVTVRGDYDYCRVLGTRQLSPLEVGEDNSKLEPKKLRKIQIYQYGQTKGCYRGDRKSVV